MCHCAPRACRLHSGCRGRQRRHRVLRHGADAGQKRNLLPFDAVRIAAAVPLLVQAAYGLGGELTHSEFGDDAGAAVAPKPDHLPIIFMPRKTDMKDSAPFAAELALGRTFLQSSFRVERFGRCGLVQSSRSDPGLHSAVVSADDLTQPACIAAAANVFEKEREVEAAGLIGR